MRRSLRRWFIGRATLLLVLWSASAPAQPGFRGGSYKVIVNTMQTATTIDKSVLADIFQGKTTRWRDGSRITAVDHSSQSPLRVAFTKEILGETMASAMAYWVRQISGGGARPPVVKAKDDDVIALIASTPGGIGYVSEEATLPATVKAIKVQ
jgi:ABC-type phosphate transport system substrate-binding protein